MQVKQKRITISKYSFLIYTNTEAWEKPIKHPRISHRLSLFDYWNNRLSFSPSSRPLTTKITRLRTTLQQL